MGVERANSNLPLLPEVEAKIGLLIKLWGIHLFKLKSLLIYIATFIRKKPSGLQLLTGVQSEGENILLVDDRGRKETNIDSCLLMT